LTPIFRGIFLTSDTPEATAQFYERVASLPLDAVGSPGEYRYWRLDRGGMQIAIHEAGAFAAYSYPPLVGSNLTHLYFRIADREAFLAHLRQIDVEPAFVDDVVVTVTDPDGRHVLFGTA
jgi:predicted enzyme related to lactoylglutathione lyase